MITIPHLYSAMTSFLASLLPHLPHSPPEPPRPPSLSIQSDPFKTELNYVTPVFNLPAAPHFIQGTPQALQGPHNLYNPTPSLKFCFLLGYSLAPGCCVARLSQAPFTWFAGLFVLLNTDLSKACTDLPIRCNQPHLQHCQISFSCSICFLLPFQNNTISFI